MIETTKVNGRPAYVAYIGANKQPVEPDEAVLIKVLFADELGGAAFLVGPKGGAETLEKRWRKAREEAERLLAKGHFIQDPVTGLMEGSEPGPGHGEGEGGGGGDGSKGKDVVGSTSPHAKDPTSASSQFQHDKSVSVDDVIAKVPGGKEQIAAAREKLKSSTPTNKLHFNKATGKWAPEREKIHLDIMKKLMTPEQIAAATPKAGEKPTLYILGGRGGSGKGWFTSKEGTVDKSKAVYINNDDVKELLPEYKGWNAGHLHEEASYVGKQMEQYARDHKLNTIVDATLSGDTSVSDRVKAYKDAGYRISGHYMYASPQRAAEQAVGRFVRGNEKNGQGRFVPPEYTMGSLQNEHNFDEQRKNMDYWEVLNNMTGYFKPKVVSRSKP